MNLTPTLLHKPRQKTPKVISIAPQPGPQTTFLSSTADIAIYGGAAGGGKTFGLLLDAVRYYQNPRYGAVIFRRTTPQITNEGGLWDEAEELFPYLGGRPLKHRLEWAWECGSKVRFAHLEHDKNRYDWQGSQIPFIGFDELTHFTQSQFFYMMGRNRSTSGVPSRIRATTNPDPDHFARALIDWWIDNDTGYPIKERGGVIRWFARIGDSMQFADMADELVRKFGPDTEPKSLTFIPASVFDNKKLLSKDPRYLANLKNLGHVEREQLLHGNWNVRPAAGLFFKRHFFQVVDAPPAHRVRRVRYWDCAATEKRDDNDPDWTVGVRMSYDPQAGLFYVEHVCREQLSPAGVERLITTTAEQDGVETDIWIEQDPGAGGKFEADYFVRALNRFTVHANPVCKDKVTRAKPASAQAEHGNFRIVRGVWNDAYLRELENFPQGQNDDQVDGTSGAYNVLVSPAATLDPSTVVMGSNAGGLTRSVFVPRTFRQ